MNFTQKIDHIPLVSPSTFRSHLASETQDGKRLIAFWASPDEKVKDPSLKLFAALSNDDDGKIEIISTHPPKEYLTITEDCPQAHLFEREIWENWGIIPNQHPWLKPVRFPQKSTHSKQHIGEIDFYKVQGEEIHEVGVGPVHAGIIEPGHFRFQCRGEIVEHLEISLGYQHRGIEAQMKKGPHKRSLYYMETVAGDSTIAHTLAYCKNIEALGGITLDRRTLLLRAIMLELERLANHVGDLGAMAGDVGFLPTSNYCGRIRGDFLNLSLFVCGSRFGRSMLTPGGVRFDLPLDKKTEFLNRLNAAFKDAEGAINLLWQSASVMDRFEGTGALSEKHAIDIGLVGPPARACGIKRDVRKNFPHQGIYEKLVLAKGQNGDVLARAKVRFDECRASYHYIKWAIEELEAHPFNTSKEIEKLAPNSLSLSLTEGWRGEVCHVAQTDAEGKFHHYKIVDPSFHNWFGLALALRGQEISDFLFAIRVSISPTAASISRGYTMFKILLERLKQKYRTSAYPKKNVALPATYRGKPEIKTELCSTNCNLCQSVCPTEALIKDKAGMMAFDLSRCLFCTECEKVCVKKAIHFTQDFRLATRNKHDLILGQNEFVLARQLEKKMLKLFGRSLKLRQVSAAGCNACEADTNVLGTLFFDLGRFGIQFVASPRHADGLLVTGPVSENMREALLKTYEALPEPKIVIAVGACALSGGIFRTHDETHKGVDGLIPVDLYIPGCPPHPMTILDGLLRVLGKIK